jgi:hypothetical protein
VVAPEQIKPPYSGALINSSFSLLAREFERIWTFALCNAFVCHSDKNKGLMAYLRLAASYLQMMNEWFMIAMYRGRFQVRDVSGYSLGFQGVKVAIPKAEKAAV